MNAIRGVLVTPTQGLIVGMDADRIVVWEYNSETVLKAFTHADSFTCMHYSPETRQIYAGTEQAHVMLFALPDALFPGLHMHGERAVQHASDLYKTIESADEVRRKCFSLDADATATSLSTSSSASSLASSSSASSVASSESGSAVATNDSSDSASTEKTGATTTAAHVTATTTTTSTVPAAITATTSVKDASGVALKVSSSSSTPPSAPSASESIDNGAMATTAAGAAK
jgi:hypothetical protein